jgi:bifunctional DNA-binding transcriptional regulator/antitoxin component of YhaV-PrlF toxin-antitoxin module
MATVAARIVRRLAGERDRGAGGILVRYSLLMATNVKKARSATGRSRVSSKHQITIPIRAFSEAGLREGDVVQVKAQGPGRVVIARMDDLVEEFAGSLSTGGELGRAVRGLRQEWD